MGKFDLAVSLIPLGGVTEVGKNMLAIECGDDIVVVDSGVKFPEEEQLGIDLVIPDITYLLQNRERVRGILLTHGHEDHIGALPFVLKDLNVPVYGTKLTLGLVESKLEEHGMVKQVDLRLINPDQKLRLGSFQVEFFRINHSIPDGVGLAITTPAGLIVHSGDFKLDQTPVDGRVAEFHKIAAYGTRGVLAFICDSTNIGREAMTPSEKVVGETFDRIFRNASQRIIVATFASHVHRVQQVINAAVKYGRKVAVVGRSMLNVVDVASRLGYLQIPPKTLVEVDEIDRLPREKVVILATGSQGEPMAALTRMATHSHRQVTIEEGDTVIISATPIPGNEQLVARTINNLFRTGADVIYKEVALVHVSGHAGQEEIKLMLNMLRPKYVIPFHGEHTHQAVFAEVAAKVGIPRENVFIANIGDRIELSHQGGRIAGKVPSGRVFIDGLGIGDVGNIVLRDRLHLAEEGIVIVVVTINKDTGAVLAGPDLISRGFVFVRESAELMNQAREKTVQALEKCQQQQITEWSIIKSAIRDELGQFIQVKTQRRPVILPIIMEI
ncbi:ribonuclease J [Clostridiales bacterium PH28_bin88]|nr:ribonuclease J [Clostridiales bacterium PH28_bin88]